MEKKVGEQLKALRESKKISLKTISQKSKIGLSLLQYLEADEYDKLPNKIYVIGFIKNYAATLGVDERPLIETFEAQVQPMDPVANLKYAPVPGKAKKNPIPTLIATALVSGVLCFIGIFFIYKNTQQKLQDLKAPIVVKTQVVKPKVIEAPKELPKEEPVKEAHIPEEKFSKITEDLYSFRKDDQSLIESYLPKNIKDSMVPGKQNLFLNALKGDSWITYKIDNEPIRKFILEKDKTLLLRGDEIRLFIGNVNATLIFLNNKPLDIPSKSGVKSLVFPEENKDKYKIPLFVFKEDGTVSTSDEYIKPN